MSIGHINRVIWAIDPFSKSKKLKDCGVQNILALTRGTDAVLEPVYVTTPAPANLSTLVADSLHNEIENAMKKWLKEIEIPGLVSYKVLTQKEFSLRLGVNALTKYAKKTRADVIVVGTHGRRGVSRLVLGSFAETLLLQSEVPVFIVSRKLYPTKDFKKILFPTDLSDKSKEGFSVVLDLAEGLKARVEIFHQYDGLGSHYLMESLYNFVGSSEELDKNLKLRQGELDQLVGIAKARGITAKWHLGKKGDSVSEATLKFAESKNIDLIAMVSQTGPIASAVLGSVTRQIIRRSHRPVWIIHPMEEVVGKKSEDMGLDKTGDAKSMHSGDRFILS